MKKIGLVFLSDAKRLSSNVVAIVIIMGLSIIPALYAWFNILSNWDPYGEDATSRMHISVYSEDAGFEYEGLSLNIGDSVISGLKENSAIGWVFTDSKEEALDGVYSGDYYAALIIPENFTNDMISFIGGDLEHPTIGYYENSKKNAIATKITSKVKKTVQQQVNTTFVSTLAEMTVSVSDALTGIETEHGSVLDTTITKMKDMDSTLETYENILGTFALVTGSASDLVGSTQSILPNLNNMVESGQDTVNNLQYSALSGGETARTVANMVDISMDTITNGLQNLNKQVETLQNAEDIAKITEQLASTEQLTDYVLGILKSQLGEQSDEYLGGLNSYQALKDSIGRLQQDQNTTQEQLQDLKGTIASQVQTCLDAMSQLKITFDNNIVPKLDQSIDDVQSALIKTNALLTGIDGSFSDVESALQSYQDSLNSGTDSITATKNYIADIRQKLEAVTDALSALNGDEQYQDILQMFQNDPEMIASFVSSPVSLDTEAVYKIKNYGSAMAPFYTVLALWVGGLILVALVHVKVEREDDLIDVKPYQAYFGRYIVFFLVSQVQAAITVLGNLFFVQIQCVHPFLLWLAAACSSFVFSLFMYSLTVAFGNVGEAIAVVVMVIQVAGAGGTFPIEVLPEVYQAIYKFLPFTYCLNAMRACVGGMYQMEYIKDIAILGVYVLISLFIGLIAAIPFRGMNQKIEESKERSKVLL